MTDAQLVNLTPHTLNLHNEEGEEVLALPPSGDVARVETSRRKVGEIQGVPQYEVREEGIENLPHPEEGVIYVTSGQVRSATDRNDVASPGKLIRDDDGKPVGARGLTV